MSWRVFCDADGMVAHTHGGDRDAALAAMSAYWDAVEAEPDDDLPDDFYWHGNEPDLHYASIPAMLGDPGLSARAIGLVVDTRYGDGPDGLDGNDDAGTLSAWYLLHAVGIYPVAGTGDWVVGAPGMERAEVDLEDGRTLVLGREGLEGVVAHEALVEAVGR